ncbi:MAG: response regulator [Candidatus Neomarinimicrobiota bacterium]
MKSRILIVDDEPQIVQLIALRLKANNFDVDAAYDGYQAVQLAKHKLPDLIIMDIKMPLGGGIGAYETLKSMAPTSLTPVIFITAFPSMEVKKQVSEMGAEGFIAKPFNSAELIEKVNTVLSYQNIASNDKLFSDAEYSKNYLLKD